MSIHLLSYQIDPIEADGIVWAIAEYPDAIIAEALHYDVVLLHAEASELIQAVHQLGIPVIALCEPHTRQVALRAGATDIVAAPLDTDELILRLQKLYAVDITGALDSVTHDLFNPLGITAYSLDLALEILGETEATPPELLQLINNVLSANERLHFMIEDMMDYFRLFANRLPINYDQIDMTKLIQATAGRMEKIAKPNDIRIIVDLPATLPQLHADRQLLRRVINAALDTSIKFCQPHSLIQVTAAIQDKGVSITITDPGQPIQPGFQPTDLLGFSITSTAREAGSRSAVSFSLPFCTIAMQRMGGHVALTSDQGYTHLTLWLPLKA